MSSIGQFFDEEAGRRASVVSMASYYHEDIRRLLRFLVPRDKSVVEVGCGIGDTLAGIDCMVRCGVDVSEKMLRVARSRHPGIEFVHDDIEALALTREFDYVIMSNLIGVLHDVRVALSNVRQLMGARSRLIVTYYSRVWYPAIRLAELLGWKRREPVQNWLAIEDVVNLLELGGFEVLRKGRRLLLPLPIPGLSWFLNRIVARLPWLSQL